MFCRCPLPVLLFVLCLATARGVADDVQQQAAFFEAKIRPVLVEHCYECHAADAKKLRGGLLLDHREGTRTGGDSGPAVVPGKPEESLLLDALRFETFEMPPSGKLPQQVLDDFRTWIAAGAIDPRDAPTSADHPQPGSAGIDLEAGRRFWSFQLPRRSPVPQPVKADWCENDIDRFLLAGMESAGLVPTADADRQTLIRRAYFDLIGLPPPPERIAAFLADESLTLTAFSRVVDELLESPHFGERWGRHWLDVARFAESTGGGRSLLYGTSWRYRDYVIDAFNADKPFDRFIIEQLAGDLLPADDYRQQGEQLTATAFLAIGPTNFELQDKEQLRMDVIDEQIDTVGRAFLGMTLGCARCHDHKFDPVPTTDYYALAGIFRSTKTLIHANVSRWVSQPLPVDVATQRQLDEHRAALASLQTEIETRSSRLQELQKSLPTLTLDDTEATVLSGSWKTSSGVKQFVGDGYRYASGPDSRLQYRLPLTLPGTYEVRVSYTAHSNRSPNAPFTITHRAGDSEVRLDQREPPPLDGLYASLGEFAFDREAVVTLGTDGSSGVVVADAVLLVPQKLAAPKTAPPKTATPKSEATKLAEETADSADASESLDVEELAGRLDDLKSQVSDLNSQMTALKEQAPPSPPETVVVTDEEASAVGDYHVCIRGNAKNLGEAVPRGFLSVATDEPAPLVPENSSGRLELARWIADRNNPLTARVAVNRIWHHLFGAGLVRTVDNLGASGERPSHPELLDHLAIRFVDGGWSVKSLIREIMLSRAYRLSSEPTDGSRALDPENRRLSHQNRRRLDAESIYDSILSLSGALDLSVGGNTVRADTKSEYGYLFDVGRRAVYLPVFRNRLPDLFTVFDFPDPNLSTGRRSVSTLSTQALLLMNSPFVMEQATLAAEQLLAEPDLTDDERFTLLSLRALGRPPTPEERRLADQFLTVGPIVDGKHPRKQHLRRWAGLCQAVMASLDFRFLR